MNKFIYALAAAMVMCLASAAYSKDVSEDLQNNIVRLHIIANSDSAVDQAVKLKVRDAVLETAKEMGGSPEAVKSTANRVLRENGFDYDTRVQTGLFYFPEKTYKDTAFPAGKYRAVRIILGEGGGENWWCVLYPPLCFDESTDGAMSENGREELAAMLDDETFELVTEKPAVKFKIVELVNKLLERQRR